VTVVSRNSAWAPKAAAPRLARLLGSYTANLALRKLGLAADIDAASVKREVIFPARMFNCKPAIFLDGQLEKIRRVAFGRPIPGEVEQIRGGMKELEPVTRISVNDAFVTPKYLYAGTRRKIFSIHQTPGRLLRNYPEIARGAMVSSYLGCNYFGHWLRDDCATYEMLRDNGNLIKMTTPDWPEIPDYAHRFAQNWTPSAPVFCRRLSIYRDTGQNPHKAARLRHLRTKLRHSARSSGLHDMIYLMRGVGSSARVLHNEDAVATMLQRAGFYIHEAESGLAGLESAGLDARVMVGVEGSQLSHSLYMLKDKGGLLVLQPPNRVFNSHLDWCRQLGMEYAFVVGEPRGDGFSIDTESLARTLDLLDHMLG